MNVRVVRQKTPVWEGYFSFAGRRYFERLNPVRGHIPDAAFPDGDAEFQASKAEALRLLQERAERIKQPNTSTEEYNRLQALLAKRILKTNYKSKPSLKGTPLSSLEDRISALIREKVCADHLKRVLWIVRQFVNHVHTAGTLESVTFDQVQDYLASVAATNPAARTYNEHIRQIKRIFREFAPYGDTAREVAKLTKRQEATVSRQIFTEQEIAQILEVSRTEDPLIYSMVTIASCTGLRLKDICLLKWESINFRRNMITLETHKTGGDVVLGMWPSLRKELERLKAHAKKNDIYVLPEAAKRHESNADNLLDRLRKILYSIGYSRTEIMQKRGSKLSASLLGWHSFRGSFVVAALKAGVSMELLQKVLGSKTVEIIYKHYVKVDDQFMQSAFTAKAPDFARK